jgi:nitronate monooxygenase
MTHLRDAVARFPAREPEVGCPACEAAAATKGGVVGLPKIIQGGMGAGVSDWRLARAVSVEGQLGVVSGIAMEVIQASRLQNGDQGHHVRRALAAFPDQEIADRIVGKYFCEAGLRHGPTRLPRPHRLDDPDELLQETIAATFVEIFLAKEGHGQPVGINLLTKIQLPTLASLYGAMLAGVDTVIMGAGIPREVPAILDALATHRDVAMTVHVDGATSDDDFRIFLHPRRLVANLPPDLGRPLFYPIASSNLLATTMVRKSTGRVDGLVIEGPTAGGHNAPPRGPLTLDTFGEPVYGPKDEVIVQRVADLGLPFYLAGGWGQPGRLREALDLGATGVQVGTAFAFCRESGLDASLKEQAVAHAARGLGTVVTDPLASPTGFPFKVLSLEGTLSEEAEYRRRPRACNLGFLRHLYKQENGEVGYRCPAEPEASWVAKGGAEEHTAGRKCLCNGLLANLGFPVVHPSGYRERPLVTVGNAFDRVVVLIRTYGEDYTAKDVITYLMDDERAVGIAVAANRETAALACQPGT